ncbi:MAG: alpha/beta hydrolase [Pyramidobacter sp.]|nr:alpha/beta hydrolase [Pyramidobacter sp.]
MPYNLESQCLEELKPFFSATLSWQVDRTEDIPLQRQRLLMGRCERPLPEKLADVKITNKEIYNVFDGGIAKIRIYTPAVVSEDTALVVYFRGSGFIIGRVWQHDAFCAQICKETNSVVVSADYRLAPEHPYPAAIEDCYSALVWADANKAVLGCPKGKLCLLGASAGGGMAVSAALMARDTNGPKIDFLCPLYPMLDPWNRGKSNHDIINGHVWDGAKNGEGWKAYLGELLNEESLPYKASPLSAKTYAGLPPVYTYIGSLDALQDELFFLVKRLSDDGVPVEMHYFRQCFHSFEISWPDAEVSKEARHMLCRQISKAIRK